MNIDELVKVIGEAKVKYFNDKHLRDGKCTSEGEDRAIAEAISKRWCLQEHYYRCGGLHLDCTAHIQECMYCGQPNQGVKE